MRISNISVAGTVIRTAVSEQRDAGFFYTRGSRINMRGSRRKGRPHAFLVSENEAMVTEPEKTRLAEIIAPHYKSAEFFSLLPARSGETDLLVAGQDSLADVLGSRAAAETNKMNTAVPANTQSWLRVAITPSRVERSFWRGVLWMTALILVFKGIHFLEREFLLLSGPERFVREPTHAAAYFALLPHFAIALLFALTSLRNRTWGRRGLIAGLFVAGLVLHGLFQAFSQLIPAPQLLSNMRYGSTNLVMMILVYGYFLIHDLRDETFFYRQLGDAPPIKDERQFQRFSRGLILLAVGALGSALWIVLLVGVPSNVAETLPGVSTWTTRWILSLAPVGAVAAGGCLFLRRHADLAREHYVLLRLFAAELLVLGVAAAVTSRPYPILLLHCAVWYVFSAQRLDANPPKQPPSTWWLWMRTSPQGFRVLHHGLIAGLMLFGLAAAHGFGHPQIISDQSLFLLSILHITVSFLPR
ncbi:MAG: hypothetical protein N2C14_32350 [Planctomycetales bacterium]